MRRTGLFLSIVFVSISLAGLITVLPETAAADDEVFGIYTNLACDNPDTNMVGIGKEMYLCLKNLSRSEGVSAWECNVVLTISGSAFNTGWTYAGGSNIYDPVVTSKFDVYVGTGPAALMPARGGIVHLATNTCNLTDETGQVRYHIRPLTLSMEFVDAPGYFDKDNTSLGYAVGNSNGGTPGDAGSWFNDCGTINYGVTVDDAPATWSDVKALYR